MSTVAPPSAPPRFPGPECRCLPAQPAPVGSGAEELRVELPAEPGAVTALRRLLSEWLAVWDLEQGTAEAVVLAADEALTNAVEHAYPQGARGTVRLVVTRLPCGSGRGVAVVVEDHGHWRPVPSDRRFRHGLLLIHGLADRASIIDSGHGTVVRMCWTR